MATDCGSPFAILTCVTKYEYMCLGSIYTSALLKFPPLRSPARPPEAHHMERLATRTVLPSNLESSALTNYTWHTIHLRSIYFVHVDLGSRVTQTHFSVSYFRFDFPKVKWNSITFYGCRYNN